MHRAAGVPLAGHAPGVLVRQLRLAGAGHACEQFDAVAWVAAGAQHGQRLAQRVDLCRPTGEVEGRLARAGESWTLAGHASTIHRLPRHHARAH